MSVLKKIFIGITAVLIIAIIGAGLFVYSVATRSLPLYDGTLTIKNLTQEVMVLRDKYAIPHIVAENESDLYRAVGYTLAQDRLWQMDLLRRVTQGRLSEIFGEDLVDIDLLMRSLKIPDKSKKILSVSSPKLILALECFTDGVNQFIEGHKDKLPPEFTILGYKPEPWKPEYSVNLIGYMSWDLTMPYTAETILHKIHKKVGNDKFKELIPDIGSQKSIIFPELKTGTSEFDLKKSLFANMNILEKYGITAFQGSNNWVVSGKKSVTGKPIFANDMHLGLNAPGLWYQMHQTIKGKLNVTGVVLPGQPFVIAGHNDKIAWGMTNVMVDDMDFYLEKINPDNPDQYEFMGEFKDFEIHPEIIKIKGKKSVTKQNRFTHRGPIISKFKKLGDETITMKWLGNEMSNELRSVFLLNRAKNWDEFKNAVKTFTAVSQNINYADIDGNIGLYCSAGVPIRKKGDGLSIVPGWTDEYDWEGIVPFEQLPHSYNPESGYVSSANGKTAPDNYPYHISYWYALHYRIDRIRQMLEEKEKLSVEDFQKMHGDFKSRFAMELMPLITKELNKIDKMSDLEKSGFNILQKWDLTMDKKSRAAAIFDSFYVSFVKNMVMDEIGPELYTEYSKSSYLARYLVNNIVQSSDSKWSDNVLTSGTKENLTDIVYKSFSETISNLSETLGDNADKWRWGSIHKLKLAHPLGGVKIIDKIFGFNNEPKEVSGSFHTVCPYAYKLSNPFVVNHGASHRHIFLPGNWDESLSVIPTGNSGIPSSDHYCDQTDMYVNNEYHPDYFSMDKVKKAAEYKLKMSSK
ncbi:MAG: penicillin acylase family protein [Desulfobacula sp.]|uniref:penicillin acylase family protein n=1 Tax=Desulfobacula sp. TaxID=2593537 RepID=UPI001D5D03B6|nr:penicillin acylase family protein [Desulfobacula sp.]MBT3484741.1 penicillin acylase family protein [Desulfobacula sp.]MBT3804371.1 penicillin acylase family protein [Desulfobacula sp.]MBT4025162.1 penicillin acylase family protein [Desulfobacula sp.]MBT4198564.1 penicillin acylase family protein [Desulfobacula sp.]